MPRNRHFLYGWICLIFSSKSNIIVFGGANMIFTTAMLRNKYKNYANPLDKIKREIRNKKD